MHLSNRGYYGKILFNHSQSTLTLRVSTILFLDRYHCWLETFVLGSNGRSAPDSGYKKIKIPLVEWRRKVFLYYLSTSFALGFHWMSVTLPRYGLPSTCFSIINQLCCLDEFDVFMDAVNRRISMKMMIDTANTLTRNNISWLPLKTWRMFNLGRLFVFLGCLILNAGMECLLLHRLLDLFFRLQTRWF